MHPVVGAPWPVVELERKLGAEREGQWEPGYPTMATGCLLGATTYASNLAEQEERTPGPAVEAVRGMEVEPNCSMQPEVEIEETTVGTDGCTVVDRTLAAVAVAVQSTALPPVIGLLRDRGCLLGSVP